MRCDAMLRKARADDAAAKKQADKLVKKAEDKKNQHIADATNGAKAKLSGEGEAPKGGTRRGGQKSKTRP